MQSGLLHSYQGDGAAAGGTPAYATAAVSSYATPGKKELTPAYAGPQKVFYWGSAPVRASIIQPGPPGGYQNQNPMATAPVLRFNAPMQQAAEHMPTENVPKCGSPSQDASRSGSAPDPHLGTYCWYWRWRTSTSSTSCL